MCSRKFSVAKKFMDKRGKYQDFPWKIFCPKVPIISVGGIVQCLIIFGYRKSLDKRGGVSRFSIESFLSHSAENFRRWNPLVFH